MVDGDHGHPRIPLADLDLDSRFRERGIDRGVDGDRVVRVGRATKGIIHINCQSCLYPRTFRGDLDSLARNIDDDAQPPVLSSLGDEIGRQELRDRGGQIDAVDKDVDWAPANTRLISHSLLMGLSADTGLTIEHLRERSSLGGLSHVPLDDVLAR
jgi:hypothetical protein